MFQDVRHPRLDLAPGFVLNDLTVENFMLIKRFFCEIEVRLLVGRGVNFVKFDFIALL